MRSWVFSFFARYFERSNKVSFEKTEINPIKFCVVCVSFSFRTMEQKRIFAFHNKEIFVTFSPIARAAFLCNFRFVSH